MIFDTTFVIDVMKNDKNSVEKLKELIENEEVQLITVITVFELFSGLAQSKKPEEEKNKIKEVLKGQTIIQLDKKSAEKGGEIDGNLVKEGKTISPLDCMIAGITITKKEKLLTRNIEHFQRIKDLEIETY